MDLISVIVPVYKVQDYLEECVDSIKKQTYKNLEIILVDDGSPDNSGKMCDELAKEDERIKVIHKENGGLSDARNAGMDIATGKYITFVDSDDFIPENAIEKMYNPLESNGADFVTANYIYCSEDGTLWEKPVFDLEKYKDFKLSIKDYQDSFYILNSSVWNKMFRKSFLDEIGVKFAKGLPAEDAIFSMNCFVRSKNVYYVQDVVYYYRQRGNNGSISTNCSYNYFMGISKAYRMIYEIFKDGDHMDFYRCVYAKNMTYMLYKYIDSTVLSEEERIEVLSEMRWFYRLSVTLNVPACQKSLGVIIDKIIKGQYDEVIDVCKVIADVRTFMTKEQKERMSKPPKEMYEEIINSKY